MAAQALEPVRLFDYRMSGNGYKSRLAMHQLGIEAEVVFVDIVEGATHTPEFLARNPMGQIPVLELSDGSFLPESNAILWWLTQGTRLMPRDALEQARVLQWMFFEQSNIDQVLGRTRFLKKFPDFRKTTQADWDGWYAVGNHALGVLEQRLASRDYLVASRYTAADICLYGYVHSAEEGGFVLADFPHVERWLERVRSQDRHITIDD